MNETMTPEQGSGDGSVDSAASQILSLMDGGEPSQEQVEPVESEEIEAQEEEYSDEVEESEEVEEHPVYRIKAAGEEKDVTLEELVKSYQLGADYTKKTQEVAEQRKVIEAERRAIDESKQLRDSYAQRLNLVEQFLASQNQAEDLDSLKDVDPIGYAVKVAEMSQREKQLAAVRVEQDRLAQEQQADYAKHMQRVVAEEAQKLATLIPEYSDPEKGAVLRKSVFEAGRKIGYSQEELNRLYDSRDALTLYYATKYLELQNSKPQVTKKVSEAPKIMKSGVAKAQSSEAEAIKKEKARLRNSGRVADAAALFERFI
jgi:hypothetical protein